MAGAAGATVGEDADVRADMKVQRFGGTDGCWGEWCPRFEAYTALLGFEDIMREAAESLNPLISDQLGDRARQASARFWHLLITWRDGKTIGVIKLSRRSGLEAWRQLRIDRESRTGNRWAAMLRFILNSQDK